MLSRLRRLKLEDFFLPGIFLLAAFLRLYNLGNEPFWGDEVLSLDISTHFASVGQLLRYLQEVEVHPPFYYLLLHYWTTLFGVSEFSVRLPSVIFGLATVILSYRFSWRLFYNKTAAYLTALFVAVLPLLVEYGMEARPYGVYLFFALLAAYGLWRYEQYGGIRYALLYAASGVVGLYLHYSFSYFIAAASAWWLWQVVFTGEEKSKRFMVWLCTHVGIVLGFAWWLPTFIYKSWIISDQEIFGMSRKNWVYSRPTEYFEQLYNQMIWASKIKELPPMQVLIAFVAKVVLALSTLAVVAKFFQKDSGSQASDKKALGFLLVLSVLAPLLYIFAPQAQSQVGITQKHMIFVALFLAVMLGYILSLLSVRVRSVVLVIFLASLVPYLSTVIRNDVEWNYQYRLQEAGEYIDTNYQPGDLVIVNYNFSRTILSYYLKENIPVVGLLPANFYGLDFWDSRSTLGFIENESQLRSIPSGDVEVSEKLSRLDQMYSPQRIWLYGFTSSDSSVHEWFAESDWRHPYRSIGNIFLVDMYAKK